MAKVASLKRLQCPGGGGNGWLVGLDALKKTLTTRGVAVS